MALWLWLWLSEIEQSGTSRPLFLLLLLLLSLLCCNVRSKAASSSFLLPLLPVLATGACGFAVSAPAGSCRHMPIEEDYDNTGLAEADELEYGSCAPEASEAASGALPKQSRSEELSAALRRASAAERDGQAPKAGAVKCPRLAGKVATATLPSVFASGQCSATPASSF